MTSISSTIKVAPQQENKLLKILGLGFGLAIVIGGTLGVGILRMPGIVAAGLGSMTLIIAVWILGGIYALIGANTFSELATMLPKAGGGYVYIRRAYGDFFGFAGGMNEFILNLSGLVLGISRKDVTPPLAQARLAVVRSSLCSNPGSRKWT